jgi:3,4-dihydroxy 2-butanone 4-phosphate synthase / GTP cyclohydrolase II
MFTGIVTDVGTVRRAEQRGDLRLEIACGYDMATVDLGASIACSGVCLTVVDKGDDWFAVDVSGETVSRTAAGLWREGARLNLERSLRLGDELGGHIVTGHVDAVAEVIGECPEGDSLRVGVRVPRELGAMIAPKGSIALDGVSLTVNNVRDAEDGTTHFSVNVIPHTARETTLGAIAAGRQLNVEVDVLARYIDRMLAARSQQEHRCSRFQSHCDVILAPPMSTTLIERLNAIVATGEVSRAGLARAAGLHPNSLRKLGQSDWNPTADTLARLEKLIQRGTTEVLVGTETIINEARNGRMFILVDDDDRENEGDLIVPAQMATPDSVNFMARHGRGLICLALTKERADRLGLEPMARTNRSRNETAFTVSIEAKEGISTGISAADRARTIAVAIDAAHGPEAIVSPGHVFPLVARPGGVLVRAGHTEAAVDIARLAGLNPSAVICEIMREDGTMARLDDLMDFARAHGLKIGTIRDLIAYRLKKDHLVERVATSPFVAQSGAQWQAQVFRDKANGEEQLALVHGTLETDKPVLVRMHSLDLFADVLGEAGPRSDLLHRAMRMIEQEGSGVVVALHAAAPGSLSRSIDVRSGKPAEGGDAVRGYGTGAQILAALGIHDMILLTNTHHSPVALSGYGLAIVEERPIAAE